MLCAHLRFQRAPVTSGQGEAARRKLLVYYGPSLRVTATMKQVQARPQATPLVVRHAKQPAVTVRLWARCVTSASVMTPCASWFPLKTIITRPGHTRWPLALHETCPAADAMETAHFHPTVELHRPLAIWHHVGQAGSPNPTRTERPSFCTNALSPGIRPAAESALSWQFPLACPGMQGTRSNGHHLPATLSCHWRWSQCSGLPQTSFHHIHCHLCSCSSLLRCHLPLAGSSASHASAAMPGHSECQLT